MKRKKEKQKDREKVREREGEGASDSIDEEAAFMRSSSLYISPLSYPKV